MDISVWSEGGNGGSMEKNWIGVSNPGIWLTLWSADDVFEYSYEFSQKGANHP